MFGKYSVLGYTNKHLLISTIIDVYQEVHKTF